MNELEEKLGAVMNNPQLMQQLLSVAQSLGSQNQEPPKPESPPPGLDPRLLQGLAGLTQQGGVDADQQALLSALCPYLSRERIQKLERAMRAARLAGAASAFLGSGGLQMLTGR